MTSVMHTNTSVAAQSKSFINDTNKSVAYDEIQKDSPSQHTQIKEVTNKGPKKAVQFQNSTGSKNSTQAAKTTAGNT